jgi:hypothetical protein
MNSMWPLFIPGAIGQFVSVLSSLLVFLVFVGMGGTIYYQNQKIDSLKKTIAVAEDSIKMEQSKTDFAKTNTNAIKNFYDRPRPTPLQDGKLILDELFKNTPK